MNIYRETIETTCVLKLMNGRTNQLNISFLEELEKSIIEIENDSQIRTVVLTSGLPFGFSSGLDLSSLYVYNSHIKTADNVFKAVKKVYDINKKIISSKKIYISALSGPVIGSAMSIVLSCDLRIADKTSWFWLPDPQYGGLLGDGGIELLCKLIGNSRAGMLLLTNDRVNSSKADELGLLYKLVSCDSIKEAIAVAKRLSSFSYESLDLTKQLINESVLDCFCEEKLKEIVYSKNTFKRLSEYFCSKNYKGD